MENLRRGNEKHYKKCPYNPEIKRGQIRSKTWASFTLNLPTFFYRESEAKNLENWTTDITFVKVYGQNWDQTVIAYYIS